SRGVADVRNVTQFNRLTVSTPTTSSHLWQLSFPKEYHPCTKAATAHALCSCPQDLAPQRFFLRTRRVDRCDKNYQCAGTSQPVARLVLRTVTGGSDFLESWSAGIVGTRTILVAPCPACLLHCETPRFAERVLLRRLLSSQGRLVL